VGSRAPALAVGSEFRRAAKALVESRVERFETPRPIAEAKARLAAALRELAPRGSVDFTGAWTVVGDRELFEARFTPPRRTRRLLDATGAVLMALIGASAWVLYAGTPGAALTFLLPLATALAVLAFPFASTALGSQREADEAHIRGAIRRALEDADAQYPPPAAPREG
jgi:hypothetical protein